ncbi:Nif3-like dinuclear metal center hexameric protein [Chryseolinea sp. T2]|uniref:Nif3-like dinuclear metal center hexameric protein n=1 Tax=Chryseolinea sp. T2 TaxID=3129255 RepID=UPI003077E76A
MSDRAKVRDVIQHLESIAPPGYQESYDNSGLIVGDFGDLVNGVLVTLDCTEAVVDEAIASGCNLIVAHHPIVFKGLKRLNGHGYVERVVIKALRANVAIYAIHTNLDNVLAGVNRKICELLGLTNLKVLQPRRGTLSKLVTFVPSENSDVVLKALYAAGAGNIGNYSDCSFSSVGIGSFTPNEQANPALGSKGVNEKVEEVKLEVIFPSHLQDHIVRAMRNAHPYEEVAHYITSLSNENQEVGAGMVGDLPVPLEPMAFLKGLKNSLDVQIIRATRILDKPVSRVAVCGGAGSFLLKKAIQSGAQVFVSADFKYHEFFDADDRIIIADIGHYESEVHTKQLLRDVLMKKFPTFAIIFSKTVTNPISYI